MKSKVKPKLTKEQKEAQEIVKEIEGNEYDLPVNEKDILNWSPGQLQQYVLVNTTGLSPRKKMKFAKDLNKRIKKAKELREKTP